MDKEWIPSDSAVVKGDRLPLLIQNLEYFCRSNVNSSMFAPSFAFGKKEAVSFGEVRALFEKGGHDSDMVARLFNEAADRKTPVMNDGMAKEYLDLVEQYAPENVRRFREVAEITLGHAPKNWELKISLCMQKLLITEALKGERGNELIEALTEFAGKRHPASSTPRTVNWVRDVAQKPKDRGISLVKGD